MEGHIAQDRIGPAVEPEAALRADRGDVALERSVYAARVRALYSGIRLLVVANVANAIILALVHRNVIDSAIILAWVAFLGASVLWRIYLIRRFEAADPPEEEMPAWARRYVLAVGWTGVAWGAAGIFMLPQDYPANQIVTAFVLGGMAAGSVITLSRIYAAYLAFVLPTLIPVALQFLLMGGETGYGMAAMYTLFLAFLLRISRSQGEDVAQSYRLANENAVLVRDLQEQGKRLREHEASLEAAQRIAGLGSWSWDAANDTVFYSDEGYRIFGLEKGRSTYADAMDRIPEEDRKRIEEKIQHAFETGEPYSIEHRLMHPELGMRVLQERVHVTRNEAGEVTGLVGTAHDVTDQYRAAEELRAASAQAEFASEAKSQFLANMSHEFRTPLNAIIGYSEILREDAIEQGQTECLDDLDRINAAGRHLLLLVNEVLDLSKIEAGKTELYIDEFSVPDLVEEAVSTIRGLVEASGNELRLECGADAGTMVSDAMKLRQVLYNLLSNAGKFTQNGQISVIVERQPDSGDADADWLVFTVQDTGMGMEPGQIEAAFTAFDQLDPKAQHSHGGTGLGLAITRYYCGLMGGGIEAASEPGKGSCFTVRLPAVAPPAAG